MFINKKVMSNILYINNVEHDEKWMKNDKTNFDKF